MSVSIPKLSIDRKKKNMNISLFRLSGPPWDANCQKVTAFTKVFIKHYNLQSPDQPDIVIQVVCFHSGACMINLFQVNTESVFKLFNSCQGTLLLMGRVCCIQECKIQQEQANQRVVHFYRHPPPNVHHQLFVFKHSPVNERTPFRFEYCEVSMQWIKFSVGSMLGINEQDVLITPQVNRWSGFSFLVFLPNQRLPWDGTNVMNEMSRFFFYFKNQSNHYQHGTYWCLGHCFNITFQTIKYFNDGRILDAVEEFNNAQSKWAREGEELQRDIEWFQNQQGLQESSDQLTIQPQTMINPPQRSMSPQRFNNVVFPQRSWSPQRQWGGYQSPQRSMSPRRFNNVVFHQRSRSPQRQWGRGRFNN